MRPKKTLHKGFDGLDVAFVGGLRQADIQILEVARREAEQTHEPVLVEIGPGKLAMHVAESGARGGYAFRCDTGPLGETWFFKRDTGENWNTRVSLKSLPLALFGLTAIREDLSKKLREMGITATRESISRVDYAVDLLMFREFRLTPENFVAHSKSGLAERISSTPITHINADDIQIHLAGRRTSSVTIGKMPGRQVTVYDKRREVLQKQKFYWFDIWDIDPDDVEHAVWRVEVRAGKKHLKAWHIQTFADLEAMIGDLLLNAIEAVRYVEEPDPHKNITRSKVHRFWLTAQEEFAAALDCHRSGVVLSKIVEGLRSEKLAAYRGQILALIPGALVAKGYSDVEAEQAAMNFLKELMREFELKDQKRFRDRLARARTRLHFI